MLRFIARRLLETIPVLFVIATVTFFMMRLAPGGPFDTEKQVSKEVRARMEAHYGLDKPLFEQYLLQMKHLLQGDLGPLLQVSQPHCQRDYCRRLSRFA